MSVRKYLGPDVSDETADEFDEAGEASLNYFGAFLSLIPPDRREEWWRDVRQMIEARAAQFRGQK